MKTCWKTRCFAVVMTLLLLLSPNAFAHSPDDARSKIDSAVLEQTRRSETTTFWIILRDKADLQPAYLVEDWNARGKFVVQELQEVAQKSQANLRKWLDGRGIAYRSFWVVNAMQVTADETTAKAVANRAEVDRIVPAQTYRIPEPIPGKKRAQINAVEWNIDRVRAPEVWSTFGVTGEDITVANIDSGVQFNHPSLVEQYRGRQSDGSFDHNYNWSDPSQICGSPSLEPCDNNGHGTHTMGTMVGDDGDANQIGVAPGVRWIAAKGCEDFGCSDFALLTTGEWILAPTDLNGANPRVDLRPHIVNNSWGGPSGDPWYQDVVDAWVASGIFPAFAVGNNGPGCGTAGSPGDYLDAYAAGASNFEDGIASFSSRGASLFGEELKPNITAPGVSVRSSVPGNGYAFYDGTSMASPHVAGAVALMWSAAPSLVGDVAATRELLDQTAINVEDLSCGGTAEDNNVWGEGLLDAFLAVDQSPRGPTGTLEGYVTNEASGDPISNALIVASGPAERMTRTDASGQYHLLLPTGTYEVIVRAFGYGEQTVNDIVIEEDTTTTQDFALMPAPRYSVSGYVRDNAGEAIANATVTILDTPMLPTTTDAEGFYSFANVPMGEYEMRAEAGACNNPEMQQVMVDGDETIDFELPQRFDGFGYFCTIEPTEYIDATTLIPLSGDDEVTEIDLPFSFPFYGQEYDVAYISTNGFLNFLGPDWTYWNTPIPSESTPNGAIYPFWDDLYVDGPASVHSELLGTAPNRKFVIEWRNISFCCITGERLDFEVVLFENGDILTQYADIDNSREQGNSATIGIENADGTMAFQYVHEQPVMSNDLAVRYQLPPSGFVEGSVTDANDELGISNATVRAMQDDVEVRSVRTDDEGAYRMQLPLGTYTLEATARNYGVASAEVTIDEVDEIVTQNFMLTTPRAEVDPAMLEFIMLPDDQRTKTITLANTGSDELIWEVREAGGGEVRTSSTFGLPKNPKYDPNAPTTKDMYLGERPPGWSPTAPGDVLRSWSPTGLILAWGVGYTGDVWLSDPESRRNHAFDVEGIPLDQDWPTPWASAWPADMAYDVERGLVCQVNVGGDNGIYCWDPATGDVADSITGAFPWTGISQRGLAYRPEDDTFFIGGWNEGVIYHVKGLSYDDKGTVIDQCRPPDDAISGLAWNESAEVLWAATNSPTDTIYKLNPATCDVLATLPHPNPDYNGGGLEMDSEGNLWMVSQVPNTVYLVESGVPAFTDVPWLSTEPMSGTLGIDETQELAMTVDTTDMEPGAYNATLALRSNSGRETSIRIPVSLLVSDYRQGANAGGREYVDVNGDTWSTDQAHRPGSWGYVQRSSTQRTWQPIDGTEDDPLYQRLRRDPYAYRFDNVPDGVYQVELRFAEIRQQRVGRRIFDVIVENDLVLPAYDIAYEVGSFTADDHSFYVMVSDGRLDIRLVPRRGYQQPIINALRVTQRPDR